MGFDDGLSPDLPAEGMTSAGLSDYIEDLVFEALDRVIGTGDEQYSEEQQQRFETYPVLHLYVQFREELLDAMNYLGMLDLRMRRAIARFVDANPGLGAHLG